MPPPYCTTFAQALNPSLCVFSFLVNVPFIFFNFFFHFAFFSAWMAISTADRLKGGQFCFFMPILTHTTCKAKNENEILKGQMKNAV